MKTLVAALVGISMSIFAPFSFSFFVLELGESTSYEGSKEEITQLAWLAALYAPLSVAGWLAGTGLVLGVGKKGGSANER